MFGRLPKVEKSGQYNIFAKLMHEWGALPPRQIAEVKLFCFK